MNNNTSCHFLKLPAELRLQIYSYVTPEIPLSQPRTQYSGLVYSCKQTQAEIEPTILKTMHHVLTTIAEASLGTYNDEISLNPPHTLFELKSFTVFAHVDWRRPVHHYDYSRWDHPVLELLDMHFHSLILKVVCSHNDSYLGRHGFWVYWVIKPFYEWTSINKIRAPHVTIFEFDCSAILACTHARNGCLTARNIERIVNSVFKVDISKVPSEGRGGNSFRPPLQHIVDIRKDEDGKLIVICFKRVLDSSALTASENRDDGHGNGRSFNGG